jgi:hypothetical protein
MLVMCRVEGVAFKLGFDSSLVPRLRTSLLETTDFEIISYTPCVLSRETALRIDCDSSPVPQ